MSKERRAIQVSSVSSDPQVNKEKRVTEVFLVLLDLQVPKETLVSLVLQVHLVPLVPLDYLVLLVPKELKGQRVKLDQREKLVFLDLPDLLDPLAMLSTHSPSRLPSRADLAETSMPVRFWTMQLWTPTTKTTTTAWRKSLARLTP